MKRIWAAALAGAMLLLPAGSEASVSTLEQTLGRTTLSRPVLEGLYPEAGQLVEQDLDKIVCELTAVVDKRDGATGSLSFQVMSETDLYTSLLIRTEVTDKKGRQEINYLGVLYEKIHGSHVRLQEMLEKQPKPAQLEPLKERFGLLTPSGVQIAAADCGKIKSVPENFVVDDTGRLYLLFQPHELTAVTDEPVMLLIANQ